MLKIISIGLALFLVAICGCTKTESKGEFQERQKVQAEIDTALGATHASILKIEEASQSFDLVSQRLSQSSSPESIMVQREWVLASSSPSLSDDTKASTIASCESVLEKHITPTAKNLDYDVSVKDEGDRIRISADARWNRAR